MFLSDRKERPIRGLTGMGGGLTLSGFAGGDAGYTMVVTQLNNGGTTGSSNVVVQGTGLGTGCSTSNRLKVTDLGSGWGEMRFSFSPNISSVTEWKICVRVEDDGGFNFGGLLQYRLNSSDTSDWVSTSLNDGFTDIELDLTSGVSSGAPITTFDIRGTTSDAEEWYTYLSYLKINGTFVTGTGTGTGSSVTYTFSI